MEPLTPDDFDFALPNELIAQNPVAQRDQSRLLVLERNPEKTQHRKFCDIVELLHKDDLLVLNDSKVIPARLRGKNARSGGQFEILLLEENQLNDWWVMLRPGKRARVGTEIQILDSGAKWGGVIASVAEVNDEGHRRIKFSGTENIRRQLDVLGEMPVPPYISRAKADEVALDKTRYQTVYAKPEGSVAAPTAGLHFTNELLNRIQARGVKVCFVTLHVGLGTFAPVKVKSMAEHVMHEERYELSGETTEEISAAKKSGRRVVAVGTTTVRVLESIAAQNEGRIVPGSGRTRIFIHPPSPFRIVDALITNFHLPRSTLLMLVSAFASPGETRGCELVLRTYADAVRERYRFFSYGDAMMII